VKLERAPASTGKKWQVVVPSKGGGRTVRFGALGYQDFTQHKDLARRQRYRDRHRNDRLEDPYAPGFWAWWVLWGPSTDIRKNFATAVAKARRLLPRENSTKRVEGQAEGYGTAVVEVLIDPSLVSLDDAFSGGEVHVSVPTTALRRARVVRANPPLAEYPHLQPEPYRDRDPEGLETHVLDVEHEGAHGPEPIYLIEITPWGRSRRFLLKVGSEDPSTWDGLVAAADAMLEVADQLPLPNKAFNFIQADDRVLELGNVSVGPAHRRQGFGLLLYRALLARYGFMVSDATVSKGAMGVWKKLLEQPGVVGQASAKAPRNWAALRR
jgi:hypothetical protein